MTRVNLAPAVRCESGPTLGCWERGALYGYVRATGQVAAGHRLCGYHAAMLPAAGRVRLEGRCGHAGPCAEQA